MSNVPLVLKSAAAFLLIFGPTPDQKAIEQKIALVASSYGVSYAEMHRTIECESGFDPHIQSQVPDPTGPNGLEDSWGLVQIHLPDHPTISRMEAVDLDFALHFMAREFAAGRKSQWSCYNKYK